MVGLVTSFDSVVLAAVARDVRSSVGARVTRVAQATADEITIDFRQANRTTTVLWSIHPRWARIHLASKGASGEASPFAQLLRKRFESATLVSVQHTPFERILTLTVQTLEGRLNLCGEIMGRHSNLILVSQGVITSSLKAVPRSKSSVREILPGRPYIPPPQNRPSPASISPQDLAASLESSTEPLARRLVASVLGLSPALATEVAVRAGLDPAAPSRDLADAADQLSAALREVVSLVERAAFSPVVYYDGDEPVGFTAFPFIHLSALRSAPAATMSEAVEQVLGRFGAAAQIEELRGALQASARAALARIARTEADIRRAAEDAEQSSQLRQHGELLLAYAAQIPPRAPEATVPGFDGTPVTITLDPALSAVENAQRLFKRYTRVRAARHALDARLRAAADEREYLESVLTLIDQATSIDDLAALRDELASEGYIRRRTVPARLRPGARGRRFDLANGAIALVGRTNRENDLLTFKVASPNDIWLHARGVPGAHVILKSGSRRPGELVIRQAAGIAAYFSKARSSGKAAVDYTGRKYVRKPKGARPGLVTYARAQTLTVTPTLPTSES